jgi:hypothetical protein
VPTLFDLIRRAMPLSAPWSMRNAEVYALVAYLLHENRVVSADFTADAATLRNLRLPNRDCSAPIDVDVATGGLRPATQFSDCHEAGRRAPRCA